MPSQQNHFTLFKQSIDEFDLPERFTFPFYYQPHPLCLLAVQEVQYHLNNQINWQHNFGLEGKSDTAIGKMFGVLLVKNKQGEVGYITAFSGKVADSNHLPQFVPPVFDMLSEDGFFRRDQNEITKISNQIRLLVADPDISVLQQHLAAEQELLEQQVSAHRERMIAGRKDRKKQRLEAIIMLKKYELTHLNERLNKQSIQQKNDLRDLNLYWDARIENARYSLHKITDKITLLKSERKKLSVALQNKLFDHYRFLNEKGIEKNLGELFKNTSQQIPPAGAGECAAPKLLHYAFKHGMKPLALAEFWWGASPKSEIRRHKNFYTACRGKCQPILAHMLEGIELDDNPLLTNHAEGKDINIVYEDDVMVVINKPAEFLSVPGKSVEDSVYLRMKQRYPNATGSLIVHRLDMSTSGLMVVALSKEAHKELQKQFINRTVEKRYVALLDGVLTKKEGVITLPLRVDIDDRPRQLVCYEHGKSAETKWQIVEQKDNTTTVYFYPKTGRTHQLRVHSAHINGLNMPIVGDDLYGRQSNRLHLHAESLAFNHPMTKELMHFQLDANFL